MSSVFRDALNPKFAKLRDQARMDNENQSAGKALRSARLFWETYRENPEANYEYARALVRNNKSVEALEYAEFANLNAPNIAKYIFLLGRLFLDFQLYEFAAPLLRNAIVNLPKDLLMHWAMADLQFGVGNGVNARKHYEIALALNPNSDQKLGLLQDYINCLSTINVNAEALRACDMLAQLPGCERTALVRRSTLEKNKDTDPIAAEIREIAIDEQAPSELRSNALLSLGNMYNNNGRYDQAFEHWTKSRSFKQITHRNSIGYDALKKIIEFYPKELFILAKPYGHKSEVPVFVVGMPRSGTTLTEQIIASHPEAYGVGELGRMIKLDRAFQNDYGNTVNIEGILTNAKKNELCLRAEEVLNLVRILAGHNKKRVVDKMPTQYVSMGLAALYFPNAKFIHCERHPADSFISAFQGNLSQFHEYSFDQTIYAETYLTKQALMTHWRGNLKKCRWRE